MPNQWAKNGQHQSLGSDGEWEGKRWRVGERVVKLNRTELESTGGSWQWVRPLITIKSVAEQLAD